MIDTTQDVFQRRDSEHGGSPTKLGFLKVDVDNLGFIFSHGLEGLDSISRYTMLSFMFDAFFSMEVNKLAALHNIYIVFSGGNSSKNCIDISA
jgi:CRISPR-associated protein Csm1